MTDPVKYKETKYFKKVAKLCAKEAKARGAEVDWAKVLAAAERIGAMVESGEIAAPMPDWGLALKIALGALQNALKLFAMEWEKLGPQASILVAVSLVADAMNLWKQTRELAAQMRACAAAWRDGAGKIRGAIDAEA